MSRRLDGLERDTDARQHLKALEFTCVTGTKVPEKLLARRLVGERDIDALFEAAQERVIEVPRRVGRCEHHD